jgi:hypothetical protein
MLSIVAVISLQLNLQAGFFKFNCYYLKHDRYRCVKFASGFLVVFVHVIVLLDLIVLQETSDRFISFPGML